MKNNEDKIKFKFFLKALSFIVDWLSNIIIFTFSTSISLQLLVNNIREKIRVAVPPKGDHVVTLCTQQNLQIYYVKSNGITDNRVRHVTKIITIHFLLIAIIILGFFLLALFILKLRINYLQRTQELTDIHAKNASRGK